jgi:hypothetical protein
MYREPSIARMTLICRITESRCSSAARRCPMTAA